MNPKISAKLEKVFENAMDGKWQVNGVQTPWYYKEDLQNALEAVIQYYNLEVKNGKS